MRNILKNKTILLIISAIIVIGCFIIIIRVISGEDTWICEDGAWVKHGLPSSPKPTTGCGDLDISSFEDCQNAGMPVLETYPRQCTANGSTFTEIIGSAGDGYQECLDDGGRWETTSTFGNTYGCNEKTLDGGKICTNSTDCDIGLCYALDQNIDPQKFEGTTQGECPYYTFPTSGITLVNGLPSELLID